MPGTAGFVLYYLRRLPADLDGRAELAAAASQLGAPAAAEWAALWKALDARRRPDDTFVTWGGTMHEHLEALRRQFAASGGMLDRVASLWMWPTRHRRRRGRYAAACQE